jgi:hypothetical protein
MNQLLYVLHHNAKPYPYNDVMLRNLRHFEMIYTSIQDQQHILVYMRILSKSLKLKLFKNKNLFFLSITNSPIKYVTNRAFAIMSQKYVNEKSEKITQINLKKFILLLFSSHSF